MCYSCIASLESQLYSALSFTITIYRKLKQFYHKPTMPLPAL